MGMSWCHGVIDAGTFLAPSCSFIDTDCPLGPNVEVMGHWVDNGVQFLGQTVGVPFTKGSI